MMNSFGWAFLAAYVVCWSLAAVMAKRDNVGMAALALFSPVFVVWIGVMIFAAVASVVAPVPNRPPPVSIASPPSPPLQRVELEILSQQAFDPPQPVEVDGHDRPGESARMRTECDAYLQSKPGEATVTFKQDVTGTKYAYSGGLDKVCTPLGIWFIDYGASVELYKYSTSGDMVYRILFERPPGSDGAILPSTFAAYGGYLNFDWWNLDLSGSDRHMSAYLKARVREPGTEAASAQ